ncbi:MAG: DUF4386 domain-containing protein, partial [Thiomicrorhabdus sp.]|nr:DUF4386 domain-containing protein [Thiomicrorhabdus sp.]
MRLRTYSMIAGLSYFVIFFAAIFANFFVIESMLAAPLQSIQQDGLMVRLGILAFLITVVFDVVVAWALYELFKQHVLSVLSTLFRMMHAAVMGVAIFALPIALQATTDQQVLQQVEVFNTIWLIGLFFFGIHLLLLSRIVDAPKFIVLFLAIAGLMYIADTVAHFILPNYESYAAMFLLFVALPSVVGEMSLA